VDGCSYCEFRIMKTDETCKASQKMGKEYASIIPGSLRADLRIRFLSPRPGLLRSGPCMAISLGWGGVWPRTSPGFAPLTLFECAPRTERKMDSPVGRQPFEGSRTASTASPGVFTPPSPPRERTLIGRHLPGESSQTRSFFSVSFHVLAWLYRNVQRLYASKIV
jgi:hypothetical protein